MHIYSAHLMNLRKYGRKYSQSSKANDAYRQLSTSLIDELFIEYGVANEEMDQSLANGRKNVVTFRAEHQTLASAVDICERNCTARLAKRCNLGDSCFRLMSSQSSGSDSGSGNDHDLNWHTRQEISLGQQIQQMIQRKENAQRLRNKGEYINELRAKILDMDQQ